VKNGQNQDVDENGKRDIISATNSRGFNWDRDTHKLTTLSEIPHPSVLVIVRRITLMSTYCGRFSKQN